MIRIFIVIAVNAGHMLAGAAYQLWRWPVRGEVCETPFVEPAVACHGSLLPQYDGCAWRCQQWMRETP